MQQESRQGMGKNNDSEGTMKQYYQDQDMQNMYEALCAKGMHYQAARRKVEKIFDEYDKGLF
jgi:hypothetical protein